AAPRTISTLPNSTILNSVVDWRQPNRVRRACGTGNSRLLYSQLIEQKSQRIGKLLDCLGPAARAMSCPGAGPQQNGIRRTGGRLETRRHFSGVVWVHPAIVCSGCEQ